MEMLSKSLSDVLLLLLSMTSSLYVDAVHPITLIIGGDLVQPKMLHPASVMLVSPAGDQVYGEDKFTVYVSPGELFWIV